MYRVVIVQCLENNDMLSTHEAIFIQLAESKNEWIWRSDYITNVHQGYQVWDKNESKDRKTTPRSLLVGKRSGET